MKAWIPIALLLAVVSASLGYVPPPVPGPGGDEWRAVRAGPPIEGIWQGDRRPLTLDGSAPTRPLARRPARTATRERARAPQGPAEWSDATLRMASAPACLGERALSDRRREIRRQRPASLVSQLDSDAAPGG